MATTTGTPLKHVSAETITAGLGVHEPRMMGSPRKRGPKPARCSSSKHREAEHMNGGVDLVATPLFTGHYRGSRGWKAGNHLGNGVHACLQVSGAALSLRHQSPLPLHAPRQLLQSCLEPFWRLHHINSRFAMMSCICSSVVCCAGD